QTGGRNTGGNMGGTSGLGSSGLSTTGGLGTSGGQGGTGGLGGNAFSGMQSGPGGQTGNPTFSSSQGFIGGQNFGGTAGGMQGNRNRTGGQNFGGFGGQNFGNLFGNNFGGQFGQSGMNNRNGFEVQRGSVRAVLVNRIELPPQNNVPIQSRLPERLERLPGMADLNNRVQVVIEGGQAVVTGNFNSVAELDRFVRQLQLEPGVYRIDNRATIGE
ncbi:MAG TPA: BON domain-containing protein, partial [Pirellulaceae bacterium]|nr:BON domain-containing protein [Pirellulaceae bacterium]